MYINIYSIIHQDSCENSWHYLQNPVTLEGLSWFVFTVTFFLIFLNFFLYNLRLNNSDSTPFNGNYSNKCSENAELPPRCYLETTPSVQFVRDAVYSLAYALQDIYKNKCRFNALCLEHRSMIGEEIRKHLIDVQFEGKELYKTVIFERFVYVIRGWINK